MPTYLQTRVLSKAEALGLKARMVVEGLRVGDHKSPFRGFSVEFVQHREYVPGDDIRHIDWKSYGRSERYTIKQYEQETNFIAHILLDASKSMLYGDGEQNKLERAKLLAATLSYVVIRQRDSISLNVIDTQVRYRLPVSSQSGHIQAILETLEQTQPAEQTNLGGMMQQLAERVRRRGIVFIISDVFEEMEPFVKGLQFLRFQGHDVTVFHVLHNDEIEFPFTGNIRFDGLEEIAELKTRPHLIRPTYKKIFANYMQELQRTCEQNRCDYVRVDTSIPLEQTLSQYLVRRLQLNRK